MRDNNTYTVQFKGEGQGEDGAACIPLELLTSFDCDKERYISVIGAAIKNGLSFTASDGVINNENGGRHYWVSLYIW